MGRCAAVLLTVFFFSTVAFAERHALLIGAGRFPNAPSISSLEGPVNDVASIQAQLISAWQLRPDKARVLIDDAATRAAILKALDDLVATAASGDEVFLYYSGHGTSAHAPGSNLGMDISTGAIVPSDIRDSKDPQETLAQLIVGARDIRPRLEKLDQKNVRVLVVFDACYSGDSAKNITSLKSRNANLFGDAPAAPAVVRSFSVAPVQEADPPTAAAPDSGWPYRHVVYISAAARSEAAWDISADLAATSRPTIDGKAHGAFTNALLRGMTGAADTNHDRRISYSELHGFLVHQLQREWQTPQLHPKDENLVQTTILLSSGQVESTSAAASALRIRLDPSDKDLSSRLSGMKGIEIAAGAYDVEVRSEGGRYKVMHSGGAPITQAALFASEVVQLLDRRSRANALTSLTFPRQDFNLKIAMEPDHGAYYQGERTRIQIRPDRESWLLVINIDVDGNAYVVYPHDRRDVRLARTGETVNVVELEASAPFGAETIKAWAFSEKPAFYDALVGTVKLTDEQLGTVLTGIERDAEKTGRSQAQRVTLTLPR